MDSGIKLYAIKFNGVGSSQENSVILGYWVWIGFVVAMLVIGGVYFKLLRSEMKSVDQNNDGSKEEQVNTIAHLSREVDEEADA
eukprot:scaffold40757_cov211-Skeletonema_dohrnii-CCMP3373.AAC.1